MSTQSIRAFSRELMQVFPQVIRGMKVTDALGRGAITLPQFLSLDLLYSQGFLKMKDIAHALDISLPAATGLISRLVRMGMVERVYDTKDRRVIYVNLTSKGKKMVAQVKSQRQKKIEHVFGKLSEKERSVYLQIIRKVRNILYPS